LAVESGVDELMVAGRWAESMIDGARQAGLSRTTLCRTVPELAEQVRLTMQP
jgi:hypothetical protein